MKPRFRLYRRKNGMFYCQDSLGGRQQSLQTRDRHEAARLLHARNEAAIQPTLNLQIARAYLSAADPAMSARTWKDVFEAVIDLRSGDTRKRWVTASRSKAFDPIRNLPVIETRAEHFLKVLAGGQVSANVYLRRLHNFVLDMSWLAWPIIPKRQWPRVEYGIKRAITHDEHLRILAREGNPERKQFYDLIWHLGGSQSDIACLHAEDVDWTDRTISFERCKTRWRGQEPPIIHFGPAVEAILLQLPKQGPLFPYLAGVDCKDRATEFKQRCQGLGITGVTLHSYRYAWAERAKSCGYPERFAQQALGHNSKAVHRAYARKAKVRVPSLEEYERDFQQQQVIRLPVQNRGESVDSAGAASQG